MKRKRQYWNFVGMIIAVTLIANAALALEFMGSTVSVQAGPIYSDDPIFGYHYFVGFDIGTGATFSIGYYAPLPIDNPDDRWTAPGPNLGALRQIALNDADDPALPAKLD